jgi:uncharacterized protein YwgA
MSEIARRDLILLLLNLSARSGIDEGLGGITRLQKFLFLLDREERVSPSGEGFAFQPYKAGPYSSRLYDDLEFLENLGLIEGKVTGEATEQESAEMDLSFEDLIPPENERESTANSHFGTADDYEERKFHLTAKGKEKVESLLSNDKYKPLVNSINRINSKYGPYPLSDLLYYVYTKYPEMATESEIREQVLTRRHH